MIAIARVEALLAVLVHCFILRWKAASSCRCRDDLTIYFRLCEEIFAPASSVRKTSPAWMTWTRRPPGAAAARRSRRGRRTCPRRPPLTSARAERMGGGEPGGADRREALPRASARSQRGEASARLGCSSGVGRMPASAEAGRGAVEILRMVREVDAEADDHRVALALEQDAGELGAVDEEVVGPFDPRAGRVWRDDRLVQRDGGDQRERRRGRIARLEPDQGARRGDCPAATATPCPAGPCRRSAARRAARGLPARRRARARRRRRWSSRSRRRCG